MYIVGIVKDNELDASQSSLSLSLSLLPLSCFSLSFSSETFYIVTSIPSRSYYICTLAIVSGVLREREGGGKREVVDVGDFLIL